MPAYLSWSRLALFARAPAVSANVRLEEGLKLICVATPAPLDATTKSPTTTAEARLSLNE